MTYGYGQASGIAPGAKPHAVTHVGGVETYSYDANGNMTSRDGDTLAYDAENRLRSVTSGGETVTFTYDGDGRRVLRDTVTDTVAYIGPHYEARFTKTDKREDLDDDCIVTVIDIMRVAVRWGQAGGPEDLDGSGTVDVLDIQRVAGALPWSRVEHALDEGWDPYSERIVDYLFAGVGVEMVGDHNISGKKTISR